MKQIIDEINAEKQSLKQQHKLLNENFETLGKENINLKEELKLEDEEK
jgi:hypothetical protein